MSQLPIDLDTESIQYEGHWYSRDELARRIKGMLDSGDFSVGKPSQALEQLTVTLAGLRTLAFKVTPDMAEAINQAAARQGRSAGAVIREALSDHLGFTAPPSRDGSQAASARAAPGKRPTEPEMPAVVAPQVPTPSAVIAGPGALKAAQVPPPSVVVDRNAIITEEATPEEAASAVNLNPKKKQEEENVERGWFGR